MGSSHQQQTQNNTLKSEQNRAGDSGYGSRMIKKDLSKFQQLQTKLQTAQELAVLVKEEWAMILQTQSMSIFNRNEKKL